MNTHNPEFVSALVDGELRGLRRWLVRRHLARCAVCAAEYRHQLHVRQLLAAHPVVPVMNESAELFWSRVLRDIQAHTGQKYRVRLPSLSLGDWLFRHQTSLVGAAAVLAAGLGLWMAVRLYPTTREATAYRRAAATVARVITPLPHTTATVFHRDEDEITVIWVAGLPWTANLKQMHTLFATTNS
jgi:anti-sigma factor RsiW